MTISIGQTTDLHPTIFFEKLRSSSASYYSWDASKNRYLDEFPQIRFNGKSLLLAPHYISDFSAR
jgi:hypothetical protein